MKAAAAELKKKNTEEAEAIISTLKRDAVNLQEVAFPLKITEKANSVSNKIRSLDFPNIKKSRSKGLTETGSSAVADAMEHTETVSSFFK